VVFPGEKADDRQRLLEGLMTICRTLALGAACCLTLCFAAPAMAQGKKLESWPGTAKFRCEGSVGGCPGGGEPDDRILGQLTPENPQGTYPGTGTPEGGRGAHLRANGLELWLGLRDGFEVVIDFGAQDPNPPCGEQCYYRDAFPANTARIGSPYAEFQTDVIDQSGGITPTLLDIPIGHTREARLHIAFNDAAGRPWNLSFSDARNPLAANAEIKRVDHCKWEITDGDAKAELSVMVRTSGKRFRSFEGLYALPLLITFEAPKCPAAP
jgi:hypothetical protein